MCQDPSKAAGRSGREVRGARAGWEAQNKAAGQECAPLLGGAAQSLRTQTAFQVLGFPAGSAGEKTLPANAGDTRDVGLIPG